MWCDAQLAAEAADTDAHRLHRRRTQRLFDLAVVASSSDPRRIARSLRIDLRSMRDMREIPSIGSIARIARLLGIEPASAAEVVGLEPTDMRLRQCDADPACGAPSARGDSRELLRAAIAAADLDDDERRLEELASTLAGSARTPGDLALSLLCAARAGAARGEVLRAAECARFAASLGCDTEADSVATELMDCIGIETALGEPWASQAGKPSASPTVWRPRQTVAAYDRSQTDAAGRRRHAAGLARDLLDHSRWDRVGPSQSLLALGDAMADAEASGCPRSVAWTASIGAVAALRVLESPDIPEQAGRRAMQLFVRNQLAVDQRIAGDGMAAACVLHRRRLRMLLFEWHDRIRRGEAEAALVDEAEEKEIKAMSARFPRGSLAWVARAI